MRWCAFVVQSIAKFAFADLVYRPRRAARGRGWLADMLRFGSRKRLNSINWILLGKLSTFGVDETNDLRRGRRGLARGVLRPLGPVAARSTDVGWRIVRPAAAEQLGRQWGIPAFLSPTELVHSRRPDFVISCVPRSVNPAGSCRVGRIRRPRPQRDAAGSRPRRVASTLGAGGESRPGAGRGAIPANARSCRATGACQSRRDRAELTSVQVSSTHDYHAVLDDQGPLGDWLRAR